MSLKPTYIVDLHTHLFNARYLPLTGIFKSWHIPVVIGYPIAKVCNAVAGSSRFNDLGNSKSLESLSRLNDEDKVIDAIYDVIEISLFEEVKSNSYLDPIDALDQNELYSALEELAEQYSKENDISFDKSKTLNDLSNVNYYPSTIYFEIENKELFSAILKPIYKSALTWALKKLAKITIDKVPMFHKGVSALTFISTLLKSERNMYESLTDEYGAYKIDLYVHYMMDMEKSYKPGKPHYDFKEKQIPKMSSLVRESRGRLVGFTAYHPMRKNHLDIIKYGLDQGNIGVKFYPPMGYLSKTDGITIKNKIMSFFAYCEGNDIPIFTHCTPVGFEAKKKYGLNSDPDNWNEALQKFPDLRLCFGHAGGGNPTVGSEQFYGWFAENEEQWQNNNNYARKVVSLCQNYKNVYCEIAYLYEILEDRRLETYFLQRLVKTFSQGEVPYPISSKICFGSDWHMIDMIGESSKYLSKLIAIFQDPLLSNYINNFFSGNALNYLNINGYLERMDIANPDHLTPDSKRYLKGLVQNQ